MTNPDNIGTIQLILVLNTVILSASYWLFQWIYGQDLMSYTMNSLEKKKDAIKQDQETKSSEFTLIEVSKDSNSLHIWSKSSVGRENY